jgi:hypothetical protein
MDSFRRALLGAVGELPIIYPCPIWLIMESGAAYMPDVL